MGLYKQEMKRFFIALAATIGAVVPVTAGTVTLTAGDASGTTSFNSKGHWSDNQAPHDDADYLVSLGLDNSKALRTPEDNARCVNGPDGVYTFQGQSLTLGDVSGAAGVVQHKLFGDKLKASYPNLVFANGRYLAAFDTTEQKTIYHAPVDANITVTAPAAAPFELGTTADRKFIFTGSLKGAEGTGLVNKYTTSENGYVQFTGDCSQYFGKMKVVGKGREWIVSAPEQLGGAPTAFAADAVDLADSGAMRFVGSMEVAPVNRGLTISSGDGMLWAQGEDAKVVFRMPVAGTGSSDLYKMGEGLMVFSMPSWEANDLRLAYGPSVIDATGAASLAAADKRIIVASNSTAMPSGIRSEYIPKGKTLDPSLYGTGTVDCTAVVADGLVVGAYGGQDVVFKNMTCNGNVIVEPSYDYLTGASGAVHFGAGCSFKNRASTVFSIRPDVYTYKVCRLKAMTVPTSVLELTSANLKYVAVSTAAATPTPELEITTDQETGLQTVWIVRNWITAVQMTDANNVINTAMCWSDGEPMSTNGKYYLVEGIEGGRIVRTPQEGTYSQSKSVVLVLHGIGTVAPAELCLKANKTEIASVQTYGLARINASGGTKATELEQSLCGTLVVNGDDEHPLKLYGAKNRCLQVESTIQNSGTILATPLEQTGSDDNFNTFRLRLYGDNTSFTGRIIVDAWSGKAPGDDSNSVTLTINGEKALGAASPACWNRLTLRNGTVFAGSTETDGRITGEGRGICAGGNARLQVSGTKTMRIDSKITYDGTVRKVGTGTLLLSARPGWGQNLSAPVTGGSRLSIVEGAVKPLAAHVFDGVAVACAGGKLLYAANPEDEELGTYGLRSDFAASFDVSSANISVALDNGGEPMDPKARVALCTVTADEAAALRGKIVCDVPDGWKKAVIYEAPAADGVGVTISVGDRKPQGLIIVVE